jgi:hypothetical protein
MTFCAVFLKTACTRTAKEACIQLKVSNGTVKGNITAQTVTHVSWMVAWRTDAYIHDSEGHVQYIFWTLVYGLCSMMCEVLLLQSYYKWSLRFKIFITKKLIDLTEVKLPPLVIKALEVHRRAVWLQARVLIRETTEHSMVSVAKSLLYWHHNMHDAWWPRLELHRLSRGRFFISSGVSFAFISLVSFLFFISCKYLKV